MTGLHTQHVPLEVRDVPIDSITTDPENARAHSERDLATIRASLLRHGQRTPLTVDMTQQPPRILKGNGTWLAAKSLGWSAITVAPWEPPDAGEADAYSLVDNRSAELSAWDYERLGGKLQMRLDAGDDLLEMGWAEHEAAPLLAAEWEPMATDDEPVEPRAHTGTEAPEFGRPLILTQEQREFLEPLFALFREREADQGIAEGRIVELVFADWAAGCV